MKSGTELITEERQRQIEVEGWTVEHDDSHKPESALARAASCYALPEVSRRYQYSLKENKKPIYWPWHSDWWKPTPEDRVRELVKAGALIAAEIDRLQAQ